MISLILGLAIVGLLVYLIETYVPMAAPFKLIIRVVVVLIVILYLVRLFGLDVELPAFR